MSIALKARDLDPVLAGLRLLDDNVTLGITLSWLIARIRRELTRESETFGEQRLAILKEHGEEKDGKFKIPPGTPDFEMAMAKLKELGEQEVKLADLSPIPLSVIVARVPDGDDDSDDVEVKSLGQILEVLTPIIDVDIELELKPANRPQRRQHKRK